MDFKFLLVLCGVWLISITLAEEQTTHAEEVQEEESGLTNFQLPDLTLSDGLMRALSFAGALVTGFAGIAAILSLILPALGFKTCLLTGNCDDTTGYNSNSVYDQQGYVNCTQNYSQRYGAYQYNQNGFKRRSLEYVGPILKALTAAYDKYGTPVAQARKLNIKPAETK